MQKQEKVKESTSEHSELVEEVWKLRELGITINTQLESLPFGEKSMEKISDEENLSRGRIRMAREFAQRFTEQDMRRFEDACRQRNEKLRVTTVFAACTIEDEQLRREMLLEAIARQWSYNKLRAEIRVLKTNSKSRREPRKSPKCSPTEMEAAGRIIAHSDSLLRLIQAELSSGLIQGRRLRTAAANTLAAIEQLLDEAKSRVKDLSDASRE